MKEKMKKFNFNLGGEQSGHIILGKFATTGDGLMVALEVLFSLRKGKKASQLLNVFKPIALALLPSPGPNAEKENILLGVEVPILEGIPCKVKF